MAQMPSNYYNRFDPVDNYEQHLFRAGYVLQSAELNEIQSAEMHRAKSLGDALFKDGDVVRDAQVSVNSETGSTVCQSGAVYIQGAVRGVPPRTMTIPIVGEVMIGVGLIDTVITELEDPALRDPATGVRNYQQAGASRLKRELVWKHTGETMTGVEFFPIYSVVDGNIKIREAPPAVDSTMQMIARYDRDNTGGTYIVSGLVTSMLADNQDGSQVYSLASGRARVYGWPVELNHANRIVYAAVPDLATHASEPALSSGPALQRVDVDYPPIAQIDSVMITAEKTVSVVHGAYLGASDVLPDDSVLQILLVTQGATTYISGTDYRLTAGAVDWSLAGADPSPGTTYSVTYQYITSATPTSVDDTGFSVTGAVAGSLVLTSYKQKLPRVDRLCLNRDGWFEWIKGVPSGVSPIPPDVPDERLLLASVYQTWMSGTRRITLDCVRMMEMSTFAEINSRLDELTNLIAQDRLKSDSVVRESGYKKGLFVDPFLDNSMRDTGATQNAVITNGVLSLPIEAAPVALTAGDFGRKSLPYGYATAMEQTSQTSGMKINPYMSFSPIPAKVDLLPAIDRWSQTNTTWLPDWNRTVVVSGRGTNFTTSMAVIRASASSNLEFCRQIAVGFTISGFGPGEILSSVTFDGVAVTPRP